MPLSRPWVFNNLGSLLSLSEQPKMGHLDGVLIRFWYGKPAPERLLKKQMANLSLFSLAS
jgi:hypothetical protein